MNPALNDLYAFYEDISQIDIHIEDMALQCQALESRIMEKLENSSPDFRELFLNYLNLRDDLEVYTIRKAIRYGHKQKIHIMDDSYKGDG